ncbi:MAG TPA: DNRLRE domain-containing protein [Aeromicrobium sp.]|nr:DNRLRE domain-containing protein [Aeromicrobium sp.]HKY57657.1 DNRLRE domain-containing protein [Aeromicrobium sp.]
MASLKQFVTFISVQATKPSYSYKNPPYPPLQSGVSRVLIRAATPSLPRGSIITSATLRVNQAGAYTGTKTMTVRRNDGTWTNLATWNNKPPLTGPTVSDSHTSSGGDQWWDFDVTAAVQAFLAGTVRNYGWSLYTDSATRINVNGSSSASQKPHLVIEYEPPAKTPTDLSPQGGAVSVEKPVLTFDTEGSTTAIRVQIDAAEDGVSPDFDSGVVDATAGVLDLNDTAYAGLADGATTSWRAQHQTAAGWSSWSPWVSFSREDLDTVTLTAPAATVADPSPPFAWTFGGTQTAWQADLYYRGVIVATSGRVSGTDTSWTPPGYPNNGPVTETGVRSARVRVWDDVVRIATQGAPSYATDSADFDVVFDGTVDPMDTLVESSLNPLPGVLLTGTRAAGIPDEVAILHDGELVARLDGGDVFTTSTDFEITDWWLQMGRETEVTVVAIVNGEFADDSPSVTVTARCSGLWLVEPDSGDALVLWGIESGEWGQADIASEHQTISGRVIRRRLSAGRRSGSLSGDILDIGSVLADDTVAAFETFRDNDAGTEYRLIAGQLNLGVIAGNFRWSPTPSENQDDEVRSFGAFDWWEA